jgi:hypothetical protein
MSDRQNWQIGKLLSDVLAYITSRNNNWRGLDPKHRNVLVTFEEQLARLGS